jgi:hypothetical protein
LKTSLFVIGGEKVGAVSVHPVVTSCQEDDVTSMCIDLVMEKRSDNFRLPLWLLRFRIPPCDPIMIQAPPASARLEEGRGARARTTAATDVYWEKGDTSPAPAFAAARAFSA